MRRKRTIENPQLYLQLSATLTTFKRTSKDKISKGEANSIVSVISQQELQLYKSPSSDWRIHIALKYHHL